MTSRTGQAILQARYKTLTRTHPSTHRPVHQNAVQADSTLPARHQLTVHWQSQADALLNLNFLELIVLQHRWQILPTQVDQL